MFFAILVLTTHAYFVLSNDYNEQTTHLKEPFDLPVELEPRYARGAIILSVSWIGSFHRFSP
jgi:hypothetical protein